MSLWDQWLRQPQSVWVRKAVFQIHLWSGLLLGFYVTVVCASGSAVVFRNDIYDVLNARTKIQPQSRALSRDELDLALQRTFPGFRIRELSPGRDNQEAAEAVITNGRTELHRILNPYTGEDRGPGVAKWFRLMHWLSDLHGNLLLGANGMMANAIGGALTALLCLTGLVVWWPGVERWRRSMWIRREAGWKRMIWDLHGAAGLWTVAVLFMWGVTGAYFVFPQPFRAAIEVFTPINPPRLAQVQNPPEIPPPFYPPRRRRPLTLGGKILRGFSLAHYGNFAGWPWKALWVVLGLVPSVLFCSALIMWWNRVLRVFIHRSMRGAGGNREVLE